MPIITQSVVNSASVNGSTSITLHGVTAGNTIMVCWLGLAGGASASNFTAADTAGNSYAFVGRSAGFAFAGTPYSAVAVCIASIASGDITITITRTSHTDTTESMIALEIHTLGSGTMQQGSEPYGTLESPPPPGGGTFARGPFNGNSSSLLNNQVLVQVVAVGGATIDGQPVPDSTPPGAGWTGIGGQTSADLYSGFYYTAAECASTVFPSAAFVVPPTIGQWSWSVGFAFTYFLFPQPPPQSGNIIIKKHTVPPGSAQPFTFVPDWGNPFVLVDSGSKDSGQLPIGLYSIIEEPLNGWDTDVSQDPSAIEVDSSATTTVTFTNIHTQLCAPVGGNGVFIDDLGLYIGPSTALYTNPIPTSEITAYETTNEGRHAIVLDFNQGDGLYARDLGTIFTWPLVPLTGGPKTVLYVWQPSIIPQPEGTYGRATDWIDGGTPGDKFIQGIQIEADSFNVAKTPILQSSDDLSFHALLESPAVFNKQSIRAFSCAPFVAHSVRVISTDGVEWRVWQTKLVFEPWPELCLNWQSEMTSLGLTGWGHVREMNIAHVSTADLTLVLTFDAWPTIVLPIPNSGGQQAKMKVTLPANKFKLMAPQIFSTAPFRLFRDDLELKAKQWGSMGSYQILRPFGGPSKTGASV